MRTGLQTVRQKVRHLLLRRSAAGPPFCQRRTGNAFPADQHTGSLRTVKSLMPRHRQKVGRRTLQIQRQDPGRLGCVHNKRNAIAAAQGADLVHRLHTTEHIGYMAADHSINTGPDVESKRIQCGLRRKHRRGRYLYTNVPGEQRPGDGIVFPSGNHNLPPFRYQ